MSHGGLTWEYQVAPINVVLDIMTTAKKVCRMIA